MPTYFNEAYQSLTNFTVILGQQPYKELVNECLRPLNTVQ